MLFGDRPRNLGSIMGQMLVPDVIVHLILNIYVAIDIGYSYARHINGITFFVY
jgi:hypothetical protein